MVIYLLYTTRFKVLTIDCSTLSSLHQIIVDDLGTLIEAENQKNQMSIEQSGGFRNIVPNGWIASRICVTDEDKLWILAIGWLCII